MRNWIVIVSAFIASLGLFVGASLYISPQTFVANVDFDAKGTDFLTQMWAARQVAIAAVVGFATFRKSRPMLQTVLAIYVLMNIQDAVIGVVHRDVGLAVGASLFGCLASLIIWKLTRISPAPAR